MSVRVGIIRANANDSGSEELPRLLGDSPSTTVYRALYHCTQTYPANETLSDTVSPAQAAAYDAGGELAQASANSSLRR